MVDLTARSRRTFFIVMNELVFKGQNDQVLTNSVKEFIITMFPSCVGYVEFCENDYGKYMLYEDGTIYNQLTLANALIEYAWMHDFDKAIEVNKFLFGDCELLYYAIFTTMAEVLKLSRKKSFDRCTYLMKDKVTRLVKIGSTSDIKTRYRTLSCGNHNLLVIATIDENIENELHRRFSNKKVKGEFYSIDENEILSIIKEYGFSTYLKPFREYNEN